MDNTNYLDSDITFTMCNEMVKVLRYELKELLEEDKDEIMRRISRIDSLIVRRFLYINWPNVVCGYFDSKEWKDFLNLRPIYFEIKKMIE